MPSGTMGIYAGTPSTLLMFVFFLALRCTTSRSFQPSALGSRIMAHATALAQSGNGRSRSTYATVVTHACLGSECVQVASGGQLTWCGERGLESRVFQLYHHLLERASQSGSPWSYLSRFPRSLGCCLYLHSYRFDNLAYPWGLHVIHFSPLLFMSLYNHR